MFQFPSFPSCTYVFSTWSQALRLRGSPIRISADRGLFAAPRGFSQLVTSFVGSWCQGIHLMLFLAWTSFVLFSCLSFANNFVTMKKLFRFYVFALTLSSLGSIAVFYHDFLKDLFYLLFFWNLKIICSFSSLFSFQWPFCLPCLLTWLLRLSVQIKSKPALVWYLAVFVAVPRIPEAATCRWWAQALSSHSPLFSLILRINIRRLPLLRFRLAALAAWWAQVESNHRPHAYQACALTFWAMSPF